MILMKRIKHHQKDEYKAEEQQEINGHLKHLRYLIAVKLRNTCGDREDSARLVLTHWND